MFRIGRIILIFCLVLIAGGVSAETIVRLTETRLPADNASYGGTILRPQVCPIDSNLIAFEVTSKTETRLYVINMTTYEQVRLDPRGEATEFEDDAALGVPHDRDLAWRPVPSKGGKIWAAFISNATGQQELYLYEVTTNKYYLLRNPYDSLMTSRTDGPGWSPDGNCLTYTTNLRGNADICIIRDMEEALKDPTAPRVAELHSLLIVEEGNQFDATWCPAPGAGYFAYVDEDVQGHKFSIKIYDPLYRRTFDLVGTEADQEYFAPSWSPTGRRIAYYKDDIGDISYEQRYRDGSDPSTWEDNYALGLANIVSRGDSLEIHPQRGGRPPSYTAMLVAPNRHRSLGPAWLPGGRHLLVPMYNELEKNPFRTIDTDYWAGGDYRQSYWLASLDEEFRFPRDITVSGNYVSFVYSQEQQRYVLAGRLQMTQSTGPMDYLDISDARRQLWGDYSQVRSAGFFVKAWRFLNAPFAGPDIFINRRFVPPAVLLGVLLIGGEPEIPIKRDWRPPEMPPSGRLSTGIGFRIGF